MNHTIVFAQGSNAADPPIWVMIAIVAVVVLPLLIGLVLVVRDTIRQRGNWGLNFRQPVCSECGEPMPMVRKPANWRQALWGGGTCPQCGFELDKWGHPVETQETLAKFAVLKAQREAAERERRPQSASDERIRDDGQSRHKTGD